MFRRFAGKIPEGALALFKCHPLELTTLLEVAWKSRAHDAAKILGHPGHRSDIPPIPGFWLNPLSSAASIEPPTCSEFVIGPLPPVNPLKGTTLENALNPSLDPTKRRTVLWDHLIYAYMIENTKIYEIFRRVLYEFLYGEKLGVPLPEAQDWLRNTEELFYRDPPSFFITTITSDIRADLRASRRNAYQRMFGMDLNHGTEDGKPYPFVRAEAANSEFVPTFEEFLREVWIGIEHFNNGIGPKPTDDAKIADLVETLHDMLTTRRINGNLSREEFVFVSMMSWFHLTVEFNSPIVISLRAEASSPEQRLFKIAQRVGLPAHGLSKSYFDIADSISRVLILIETGAYNTSAAAPAFYSPGPLQDAMKTIIRHWSIITGREMKARKVVTT
jgi:hypothetical protein